MPGLGKRVALRGGLASAQKRQVPLAQEEGRCLGCGDSRGQVGAELLSKWEDERGRKRPGRAFQGCVLLRCFKAKNS